MAARVEGSGVKDLQAYIQAGGETWAAAQVLLCAPLLLKLLHITGWPSGRYPLTMACRSKSAGEQDKRRRYCATVPVESSYHSDNCSDMIQAPLERQADCHRRQQHHQRYPHHHNSTNNIDVPLSLHSESSTHPHAHRPNEPPTTTGSPPLGVRTSTAPSPDESSHISSDIVQAPLER